MKPPLPPIETAVPRLIDAERFDWTYVRDYRHYQNIMIGVYGAARSDFQLMDYTFVV